MALNRHGCKGRGQTPGVAAAVSSRHVLNGRGL